MDDRTQRLSRHRNEDWTDATEAVRRVFQRVGTKNLSPILFKFNYEFKRQSFTCSAALTPLVFCFVASTQAAILVRGKWIANIAFS